MKNRQHHFKTNLKIFFFNNKTTDNTIPLTISSAKEEDPYLREYIESYQKVTRWK